MKRFLLPAFLVLLLAVNGLVVVVIRGNMESNVDPDHLAWCDSIYHRNVGCPLHGEVEVPEHVLEREAIENEKWCEKWKFDHASCRGEQYYELYKHLPEHKAWCDSIDHANVGCLNYEAPADPWVVAAEEFFSDTYSWWGEWLASLDFSVKKVW